MDKHRFFNACMTLMNIDMHELVEAGIIAPGNVDNGGSSWKRFNDDPLVFLAKIDDEKRDALWRILESRQRVKAPPILAFDLLCRCFDAFDGEEDSVKEEHADLIAEVDAFIEAARNTDRARTMLEALRIAESFIAGFEGDEMQEGIDEKLATVRAAIDGAPAEPDYLVWSNEHRAWWRPKSAGYTRHLSEAGRYSREEARSIARNARDGWRVGAPPPEIAVRADDAEHCLAGAYLPPFEPTVRFDEGEDCSRECN